MTRENLLQAIYENLDNWSCQYTCPHTMENEDPKIVCMECGEKLLIEYENQIKPNTINEFVDKLIKLIKLREYATPVDEMIKERKMTILEKTLMFRYGFKHDRITITYNRTITYRYDYYIKNDKCIQFCRLHGKLLDIIFMSNYNSETRIGQRDRFFNTINSLSLAEILEYCEVEIC